MATSTGDNNRKKWLLLGVIMILLSISSYMTSSLYDNDIHSTQLSTTHESEPILQPYERDITYDGNIPLATLNKPHDKPTSLYSDRFFIVVLWNEVDNWPPPENITNISNSQTFFHRPEKNSMNNRFRPFNEMRTQAVIMLDDDARTSIDNIQFLFESWNNIGQPFTLMGFIPRYHSKIAEGQWNYSIHGVGGHSIILVGASLLPYASLHSYTYDLPQSARDKVDAVFNCDDLLFNFMMANLTNRPPILVSGKVRLLPGEGIHTQPDHMAKRDECLKYFIEQEFGGVDPLKRGYFFISKIEKPTASPIAT
ncbi:glycosyl transferase family 64 domain-containing protein [Paraphysoderma sedebokerense]|nr:glycosyl transferase family 64 domain-containing protein [Paraphysoderma sedebokerense]